MVSQFVEDVLDVRNNRVESPARVLTEHSFQAAVTALTHLRYQTETSPSGKIFSALRYAIAKAESDDR